MTRSFNYLFSHSFISGLFLIVSLFTLTACSEVEDKDAYLSSIRLSPGELNPGFHPQTKTYAIAVPYAATSIDITAYPAYSRLGAYINGENASSILSPINIELDIGINPDVIIGLNGEKFIPTFYTLRVTRADSTGSPSILLLGNEQVTHTQGVEYEDAGATALDPEDGDITDSIISVNPVDFNNIASYTLTYNVTDSEGFAAIEVTRTVDVVVNTAPVISLVDDNGIETVDLNGTYADAGATAADAEEGDLTNDILSVGNVDTSVADTYTITYDVTDIGGLQAAQVTRTVEVIAP